MNLNKTLGRVATTIVAGAMLTALALPVYATDGIQGSTETTINSLTITKKLSMPIDVVTSEEVTFTFSLSGADANEGETITSSAGSLDVTSGIGNAQGSAKFDAGAVKDATQTVTFTFGNDFSFTCPGVYKYTIEENDVDTDAGYTDVTDTLYAYLFVRKVGTEETDNSGNPNDNFVVYAAVVTTDPTNADKSSAKTETWVNSYKENATGSLSVTKKIEGTMASPNDEFSFTISNLTPNRTYVATSTNDTNLTTAIANEDGEATFTLKGDKSWTIKGLEAGTYTVTENNNNEGYSLTNVTNDKDNDSSNGAQVEVNGALATTEFTNTRNAVSPTGIVMNVAPYVLLVVVAAAGCFVFLRKRRED